MMTEIKHWFGTDSWPTLELEQDTIVYCNGFVLYTDDTITLSPEDRQPEHKVVLTRNTVVKTNDHKLFIGNVPP